MTDRELLEKAAKAAGNDGEYGTEHLCVDGNWIDLTAIFLPEDMGWWNPLTDDGDALRLAVTLNIGVMSAQYTGRTCAWLYCQYKEFFEEHGSDINAATRRAIVRAAAEMADAAGAA